MDPDITAGSAGGIGIFMSSRGGMTHSVSGGPKSVASRPNGVWSFNMTAARLRGGDGSQDCEDTRAYH